MIINTSFLNSVHKGNDTDLYGLFVIGSYKIYILQVLDINIRLKDEIICIKAQITTLVHEMENKNMGGLVTIIKMSGHWQSDAKMKKCAVEQPSNIFITHKSSRFFSHYYYKFKKTKQKKNRE